jgi:hypothetical protein
MNNFFNNIFKKIRGKESEKKAKEEEDVVPEINLQFQIEQLDTNTLLDKIVVNHKINGKLIEK